MKVRSVFQRRGGGGLFRSLRFLPRVHRYALEGGLNRVRPHASRHVVPWLVSRDPRDPALLGRILQQRSVFGLVQSLALLIFRREFHKRAFS